MRALCRCRGQSVGKGMKGMKVLKKVLERVKRGVKEEGRCERENY